MAVLKVTIAHADSEHLWNYHVNGRYGYVNSDFVTACQSDDWKKCDKPITWFMYNGVKKGSILHGLSTALSYADFTQVSGAERYTYDGGATTKLYKYEVEYNHVDPSAVVYATRIIWSINDSEQVESFRVEDGSMMSRLGRDLNNGQLEISNPTASDLAEIEAAKQWINDHPDPEHWWLYNVNGRYGYVLDHQCDPDWKKCSKAINWFMYIGTKFDGTIVSYFLKDPQHLLISDKHASPLKIEFNTPYTKADLSALTTDGGLDSSTLDIPNRSVMWSFIQDVQHKQLSTSSFTAKDLASLRVNAQKYDKARGTLMGNLFNSWMQRQEIQIQVK